MAKLWFYETVHHIIIYFGFLKLRRKPLSNKDSIVSDSSGVDTSALKLLPYSDNFIKQFSASNYSGMASFLENFILLDGDSIFFPDIALRKILVKYENLAVSDDLRRDEMMEGMSATQREDLIKAIEPGFDEINLFLGFFRDTPLTESAFRLQNSAELTNANPV